MIVNGFLFSNFFGVNLNFIYLDVYRLWQWKPFSPKRCLAIIGVVAACNICQGQQNLLALIFEDTHDSTFVVSYDRFVTGRIYASQRYTQLDIRDNRVRTDLLYRPNTTVNLGIGATYGKFTLNMAYGFSFLNPEGERGDTRWLDLQTRVYARKYIVDLYGQFYQGLYLRNTAQVVSDPGVLEGPYILRDDLYLQQIGVAASYIFNNQRFSYRASFVQNEWQRKSAGSLLVGFEVYSGLAEGDSSLIPPSIVTAGLPEGMDVKRMTFLEMGPSVGYAHTFVYKENWFFTGHLGFNLGLGWLSEYDKNGLNRGMGVYPNLMSRFVFGYNSPKWFFGASYINNSLRIRSSFDGRRYVMDTGNVRINVAHRFVPGPGTKRYLKILRDFEKEKK